MSNRHLSRTIAMQTLYLWDFNHLKEADLDAVIDETLKEFAPGFDDGDFARATAHGVVKNLTAIDDYIKKYAPEWPLEQITFVDRNIMRLGIYEMLFTPDIPERVAINEAIEIAKAYGGESSGKFVNGVLGAIYKDIDEHDRKDKDYDAKKQIN
ncbi:transcription antitermination factor NusB [Candidatus Falkowbacteria bacterium RIFOXYA2_FULL_47_9]|uniref:Transcription antitermination protein NusB n=2 Tax=Candidatus Falkowiibacteriota TaxID=1752728 RepID=A0A1F5SIZ9_9BACT|nr:MAG: transcription antitermination factor NusB [Candidatus Falkowbacteria bacterium RIFOXYA2_FULL_47_9]